jgi:Transposase domain (DUF772)
MKHAIEVASNTDAQAKVELAFRAVAEPPSATVETVPAAVRAAVLAVPAESLHSVADRDAGVAYQPQLLLALLTYCYAIGVYASEDIEGFMRRDENFRGLCGNDVPDALVLRRFRRFNREPIIRCLAQVLELSQGQTNPARSTSRLMDRDVAEGSYLSEARRRVEAAILLDLND